MATIISGRQQGTKMRPRYRIRLESRNSSCYNIIEERNSRSLTCCTHTNRYITRLIIFDQTACGVFVFPVFFFLLHRLLVAALVLLVLLSFSCLVLRCFVQLCKIILSRVRINHGVLNLVMAEDLYDNLVH